MSTAAMTATGTAAQRACDCLDACGDDPRPQRGEVDHCQAYRLRQRERAEAAERFELQRRIADEWAALAVGCKCQAVHTSTGRWLDLTDRPAQSLADCARYLLLRRLAAQHPDRPQLLRLIDPPAALCRITPRTTTP